MFGRFAFEYNMSDLASPLLCDLPLPPLSPAADEALRRARMLLYSATLPMWQTRLLLAGYGPDTHRDGALLTSLVSGERSFFEWRHTRASEPPADPDLPELVAALAAFRKRWIPLADAAARAVKSDPDELAEVLDYLDDSEVKSSQTSQALAFVRRLRHMQNVTFYQPVWQNLVEQGIENELPAFDAALHDVQEFLRTSPVDEAELNEINASRESAAVHLSRWLDARAAELSDFSEEDLAVLALGPAVPPEGFAPPIALIARLQLPNLA